MFLYSLLFSPIFGIDMPQREGLTMATVARLKQLPFNERVPLTEEVDRYISCYYLFATISLAFRYQ